MDSSVLPWITGGGGAIVVLAFITWAFFAGRLHSDREFSKLELENSSLRAENDKLHEALSMERKTSDETAHAARVTDKLLAAITSLAMERRALQAGGSAKDMSV